MREHQKSIYEHFKDRSLYDTVIAPLEDTIIISQSYELPLFVLQFLCNFVTANPVGAAYVVADMKSTRLVEAYVTRLDVPQILKCAWVLTYNLSLTQLDGVVYTNAFVFTISIYISSVHSPEVWWIGSLGSRTM